MTDLDTTIDIQPATAADAEAMTRLINLAYAVEAFFVEGPRIQLEEVTRKIHAGHFFAAFNQEADFIGCISYEEFPGYAYFGLLAVDPSARGMGLGRHIVKFVERRATESGRLRMTLRTVDLRTELPPWYQRQGYQQIGEDIFEDPRKIRPCKFLLFEKSLGPA